MGNDEVGKRLRSKRLIGRLWRNLPRSSDRRVVLIYHSVGAGPAACPEAIFLAQMAWLAEHAKVVSLDEIVNDPGSAGLRVALTFDDGYRRLHRAAAAIVRKYAFPATVFLNTGRVGEVVPVRSDPSIGHYPGEEFLLWKEVAELVKGGWTIGSHGIDHYDLTTVSGPEIERQVMESKVEIETRLGRPCRHFAYTWGRHNETVRTVISNCGYSSAVAAHHEPLSARDDIFALPRLDIRRDYNLADFAAVVRGEWDFLGLFHKLKSVT